MFAARRAAMLASPRPAAAMALRCGLCSSGGSGGIGSSGGGSGGGSGRQEPSEATIDPSVPPQLRARDILAAKEEGAPDTTTPLLPADDSGMGDCGPFPVRGVCLGFDTVDCVARPAATIALQYGTVYFLDYYDDSCTSFGRMMWVVLAARRRRPGRRRRYWCEAVGDRVVLHVNCLSPLAMMPRAPKDLVLLAGDA